MKCRRSLCYMWIIVLTNINRFTHFYPHKVLDEKHSAISWQQFVDEEVQPTCSVLLFTSYERVKQVDRHCGLMYRSCKPQKLQRSWMKNYNIIISIHRIWSNVEYPRLAPEDLCTLDRLTTPRMWFRCGMWCRVFASDYRHARGASTTSITVHHWLRLRVRHD
jgi:hypothetical protein